MEYKLEMVSQSFEKYRNLRFPLKVWILVNATGENRFLRWNGNKTVVLLERDALEQYLQTSESIFRCSKLSTFFWLMDLYGFELVVDDDSDGEKNDKHILKYKQDSFTGENRAYFEQLLRSRRLREVFNMQNGNCSKPQGKILKTSKQYDSGEHGPEPSTARSRLSSSSFAQEKFNLLMETKSLELSIREAYGNLSRVNDDDMVPIIEVPEMYCNEPETKPPEYTKQRLIAGNYGRADLDDLKRFFGNYLPVYDDSPEAQIANVPEKKPAVDKPSTLTAPLPEDEPPEVRPETPRLKPVVNTLDTFDYQDENMPDGQDGGYHSVTAGVLSPLTLTPFEDLGFPKDEAAEEPTTIVANEDAGKRCGLDPLAEDESQAQLCADIRETFDLLNQF
ncbi:uncharacterized protein LOC128736840 [Sabethes cyaneus]|uniref:uncharacterized protein LOC128736840 n=1 Tax=Sabethes cyaneus TaxID=53552 RepID=UPI00237D6623|nr:uncharacterized protein LOC128736840 [Sabethes cyaneus]